MRMKVVTTVAAAVFMVAVTLLAYSSVLKYDFVSFDDREYVYQNPQVLGGLSWSGLRYAWTTLDCSNWHPVTWVSLELDATIWGKNPLGYHATNLVLHCLNGVLLFLILNRATNCFYRSLCVSLLFLLHPLHVESVAWIAERKDVLSTFFLLLTIAAYGWYAARPCWPRYGLVLVLFSVGLLAKPMLVTLPLLLLLLDFWPLRRIQQAELGQDDAATGRFRFPVRSVQELVVEKIPLLVLAFIDGLITVFAQKSATRVLDNLTWSDRIANAFNAYAWYLHKTIVPTNLAVFYPHPEAAWSFGAVVSGIFLIVLISAWVVWKQKTQPYAMVGWAWFCLSLLPVIGLLQVGGQAYADRYSYVPHIGLFVLIVWTVSDWFNLTPLPKILSGAMALLSLIACLLLTRAQVEHWRNSDTLWTRALAVSPDNGVAHAHLADLSKEAGDCERAIYHISEGLRSSRSGHSANAHLNWALCLITLGRDDEADTQFQRALKLDGSHTVALDEYAKFLENHGRMAEAAQVSAHYATVLARQTGSRPDAAKELKLGIVLAKQGQFEEALIRFQESIRLAPRSAAAHNNLALTLVQLQRTEEAKANFLRAIERNPRLAVAHFCLAELLEKEGDLAAARQHFAEALRLNPNDTEARQGVERLSQP